MDKFRVSAAIKLAAALLILSSLLFAQGPAPITLTVDASHAPLKIVHAHMSFTVSPGPLTLYYPKWVPGLHEPAGPIANVTGLKFTAGGKPVSWRRDVLDVFTFHVDVPQGVTRLEASFDYLEPSEGGGPAAGSATDKLLVINWNQMLLYPAGSTSAQITFVPSLKLPTGWKFGTALDAQSQSAGTVTFAPVSLERLVDSTLIAGEYYRAIDITPPGEPIHHEVDLVADSEAALEMSPDVVRGLTNVVAETGKLFGARHYRSYHFLVTLSDHMPHFGIEHHESSDNRLGERALLAPGAARSVGGLLAHEFAHSWCGKYRRPANMNTPDFQTPMQTDLLWVYEGTTTYLGNVLAARAGLSSADDYRRSLLGTVVSLGPGSPGRSWRPLLDTAVAVPGMFGGGGWGNWRRGSDYYPEGDLLWFEVANIILRESQGKKSFEDFARAFFGGANTGSEVNPYTSDDVLRTLNGVVRYDWAGLFNERLNSTSDQAPVAGIEASGWRLVWDDQPAGDARGGPNYAYSLGLNLGRDGTVVDSIYNGPAFKAGITPGMKILGVNGRVYRSEVLSDALAASTKNTRPIELLVVGNDYYKTCLLDYHDGNKYPHLVRDSSKPDRIAEILKPLAK